MTHARKRVTVWAAAAVMLAMSATGFSGTGGLPPPAGAPGSGTGTGVAPPPTPQVRVNQVGYPTGATKVAYAMLPAQAASVSFTVSDSAGVVYQGTSTDDLGPWNASYPAVFALDFSSLTQPRRYHVTVSPAGATTTSPWFEIAPPASLYHQLVLNSVKFFTSERDGPDVEHSV